MGFLKKKDKKKKEESSTGGKTNVTTRTYTIPPPGQSSEQVPAQQAPAPAPTHTKQVTKFVGDEKHITTTKIDSEGRKVTQTKIMKLTQAEKEQLGMTMTTTPPPPPTAPAEPVPVQLKTPPPESTAQKQQQQDNQSNATTVTNLSFGDETMATIEITRELVKKFISDIWNRGEIELIPDVCHPSLRFNGHVGMDRVGHEGFARMVSTVREALTDYHCEIHSMVVETNKAFCRLRFTGKHTGNLLGYPPTGKTVSWMGASEFTCKNGKILKVWELGDVKSLEEQLTSD